MVTLTRYIQKPEIRQSLKVVHPKFKKKMFDEPACNGKGSSNRYSLVGIAFDYLLRLILKKNNDNAEFEMIGLRNPRGFVTEGILTLEDEDRILRKLEELQVDIKTNVDAYIKDKQRNSLKEERQLIKYILLLSELDKIYRGSPIDMNVFSDDLTAEIDDLVCMLDLIPDYFRCTRKEILLNPDLGSRDIGIKADADLLIDGNLIDIKVVNQCVVSIEHLNQLLGYFILTRNKKSQDEYFPEVEKVSIYLARNGYLWSMDVDEWLSHPRFPQVERFFRDNAKARS